jgi:hypothetical protein
MAGISALLIFLRVSATEMSKDAATCVAHPGQRALLLRRKGAGGTPAVFAGRGHSHFRSSQPP